MTDGDWIPAFAGTTDVGLDTGLRRHDGYGLDTGLRRHDGCGLDTGLRRHDGGECFDYFLIIR